MNYTDTYRRIYETISNVDLPHEKVHRAALKITDSLSEIYMYSNRQFPEKLPDILEIAEVFCAEAKLGGYDIDDKGYPVGYGIKADGLKNSK